MTALLLSSVPCFYAGFPVRLCQVNDTPSLQLTLDIAPRSTIQIAKDGLERCLPLGRAVVPGVLTLHSRL